MSQGELKNVCVSYDGKINILESMNLEIREGELLSLLGPSGCGKSTTLRAISGFVPITSGEFVLDGQNLTKVPVHKRDFGLVFQSYALFMHLSVYDNIAFGLKIRKVSKNELHARVQAMIEICDLQGLEKRFPKNLSGGQRQRVALARALIIEPKLLLLDEPLSNLDARLRLQMRIQIRQIQQRLKITTIFVTHDQEECFSISDRVAIMNKGVIEQIDEPKTIYALPNTEYVARFVGFDNFIAVAADGRMENGEVLHFMASKADFAKATIRPDDILLNAGEMEENTLHGEVIISTFLGRYQQVDVTTEVGVVRVNSALSQALQAGTKVSLTLPADKIVLV